MKNMICKAKYFNDDNIWAVDISIIKRRTKDE